MRPHPRPSAPVRLFCIPYAGSGAAAYRGWAEAAGDRFDVSYVQLPGRENRLRERPYASIPPLVQSLGEATAPFLDRPYALYGHSLGGIIAFELARWLMRHTASRPVHLFVSASRAPHLPPRHPPVSHLPDAELLREVHRRYESVPRQLIEDPELQELLVPGLRADLSLLETYRYAPGDPLPFGITCFGGHGDPMVLPNELREWSRHTSTSFELHMHDGKHLFLQSARTGLLSVLAATLEGLSIHA